MRKTAGFLIVFLLTTLTIITTAAGDETDISHVAHLTAANGPQITCGISCHAVDYAGVFLDGQDLANTTVCDTCHSSGGSYDGVDDPNIGAKGNWVSGVYNGSALQAGKEKWCVTCHDDGDPSINEGSEIDGVSAPNIAGDDVDYGYYKTGHGEHGNEQAVTCLACHDPALMHVDGEARTYTAAADNYQAGYRLKSVDGGAPLDVPRSGNDFTAEQFRLCFSCHESTPFLDEFNMDTNFRRDVDNSCAPSLFNSHQLHLLGRNIEHSNIWDSDWDGVNPGDSISSCPACHNVHGPRLSDGASHAPAMIRTGELIGRESSLDLDYLTSECPDRTYSSTNEILDSTGGIMKFYSPGAGNVTKNGVCIMCHGEAWPYWREAKVILNCGNCHTSGSHVAHLTAEYGPQIASCDVCHDINNFPLFSDGEDLANTTVCNPCHSQGGGYDGVDDPYIGAKTNWVSGVYDGSAHQAGKEKWCVTCHDDGDPSFNEGSEIDGVSAPNVAGNDVDYGYYKTGHGKHESGVITCLECHDPAVMHVDGDARTYAADADNYQAGYRLKSVDGGAPLDVPRSGNDFTAEQFRLCFSCHESTPFLDEFNMDTNFRRDVDNSCAPSLFNSHRLHLLGRNIEHSNIWDSDWDGVNPGDSISSCPACHNVHGPRLSDGASHAPAMIRTGELIGRESSLDLDYLTSECPDRTYSSTNEILDSTGGIMKFYSPGAGNVTKNGVCIMCHGEAWPYWREAKDILNCDNCHVAEDDNPTTVGSATAVIADATSIDISMPYTGDVNGDNTYTIDYKLSSDGNWTNWVTEAPHNASPYTDTITGLTAGETYDVRITYNDADGVFGFAEQLFVVNLTIPYGVAYWRFDEASGVTASDSIGSNDATVINGVWTPSGKSGYALSFDGDGYVEVPNDASLDITEELTIELWFKPAVTYDKKLPDYVTLLDSSDGADSYFLGLNSNGRLHLGSYGGNIQSTQASWEAGVWYHVVGTYRDVGGTYSGELYVNGVAQTLSVDNYDNMAGGIEYIGIGGSGRFINFNGIIDEVVIYNRTLTPSEVLYRYNLTTADGVAYWRFDEASGVTASDSIGSNDATVINGVWTSSGKSGYALSFDGDGYVEVPNDASLDITEEVTIELWFKPAVTYDKKLPDYVTLLDSSVGADSYFLGLNSNGRLHLGSYGGNIQSTQARWKAGVWYHVVGTYRDVGGTYSGELYVNGVAQTLSVDNYDNMAGGIEYIGIGGSDRFIKFNGIIDEVVIYSGTLTPSEVLGRYNSF